ncbi:DUF3099 domain-containing protein [Arthrobacter cavernae]|uniref:DUF3099 domain-containing protein n=1 Tax=Arthrobacter cavernae TaxID=2817681 RepID=UPI001F618EBC|nr:DUF3099 domain-containing protein [Arthrobacter cavernae]
MERDDSAVTRENSPLQQVPGDPDAVSSDPEVHSITDAAAAHSDDMRDRMIKYAVAMGIRMVCIILIFVVDGWFKIIAVAGAVFLPWIAVVIANGSDKAEVHSDALLDYVPAVEIEGSTTAAPPETPPVTVLEGELVDDDPSGSADTDGRGTNQSGTHQDTDSGEERAAS